MRAFGRLCVLALVLAGCEGPSPAPPTQYRATPLPVAVESVAGALQPRCEIAERLVAALNGGPLVVHVDETRTITAARYSTFDPPTIHLTFDVAGDAVALRALGVDERGTPVDLEVVLVGDTIYQRDRQAAWTVTAAGGAATAEGILAALRITRNAADLRCAGREAIDGVPLYRLSATGTIPYGLWVGGDGRYDAFDVWVRDDGTPVFVRMLYRVYEHGVSTLRGTIEVRYTFGEPIHVAPPAMTE